MFQNITQAVKNELFILLIISNGGEKEGETKFKRQEHSETLATQPKSEGRKAKSEGQRWNYLPVKKL